MSDRLYYESRFGLHCQKIPDWLPELVASTEAFEWIKIINPPPENPFPGRKIIGRICLDEGQEGRDNELIRQGRQGAEEYFRQCVATYDRSPYVYVWEGPNESPVGLQEQRTAFVAFSVRWVELMHDIGKKAAALSFGVGWPHIGTGHEFAAVALAADFLVLHEYGVPTMKLDGYHCGRYRGFVAELVAAGVDPHEIQIILGEVGIDGGVSDEPGQGWKSYMDESQYLHQLIQYDQKVFQDECVVCFTPFTTGPEDRWKTFDVGKSLVRRIASYVASVTPPPEVPEPPPAPPAPEPPPDPPPAPPIDVSEVVREEAYNQAGINYNPVAAFVLKAREMELGAPRTNEFGLGKLLLAQGFERGILFCERDHWDDIKFVTW